MLSINIKFRGKREKRKGGRNKSKIFSLILVINYFQLYQIFNDEIVISVMENIYRIRRI